MKRIADEAVVHLRTVGLALTMQCNFECSHCITESTPLTKESISETDALALVDEIAEEARNICFTGGESLLKKKLLLRCMERAKEHQLTISLVSNGYWATSDSSTRQVLKSLAEAGMAGICVSLDRFHLPFVPQENALRIAKLAGDFGVNNLIRICTVADDDFADNFIDRHRSQGINFQKVKVLRLGRARYLPAVCFKTSPELPDGCCSTVLSPIALPSGLVQACCGPGVHFAGENPLNLGNWKTERMRDILRKSRTSPYVMALHNLGPRNLHKMVMDSDSSFTPHNRSEYMGICELCIDMMNDKEFITHSDKLFEDSGLQLRLIAGQIYQQSYMYMKKSGFLDLPE